jgi:hypothetical protein
MGMGMLKFFFRNWIKNPTSTFRGECSQSQPKIEYVEIANSKLRRARCTTKCKLAKMVSMFI